MYRTEHSTVFLVKNKIPDGKNSKKLEGVFFPFIPPFLGDKWESERFTESTHRCQSQLLVKSKAVLHCKPPSVLKAAAARLQLNSPLFSSLALSSLCFVYSSVGKIIKKRRNRDPPLGVGFMPSRKLVPWSPEKGGTNCNACLWVAVKIFRVDFFTMSLFKKSINVTMEQFLILFSERKH